VTKISLRLKAVADFIKENSKVIDIGCDHGLLDIYLARNKNCICLATDISANCLEKAKENINKCNLQHMINTQVANGLEGINYQEYDYLVISGMGFKTIKNILKNQDPNQLIIQSNNNIEELKYYLLKRYKLIDEKIVFENGIYYVVLHLKKGNKRYKYSDYIIGINKDNLDYINYLYQKNQDIYDKMPNKYLFKKFKLCVKILVLKKYKKALIVKN